MTADRQKLERAVRYGLSLAAGKPLEQAVDLMVETLSLVVDVGTTPFETPEVWISKPPLPPEMEPLKDLAPIDSGTSTITSKVDSSKVRVYYAVGDIQDAIIARAPTDITVTPEGQTQPLKLHRAIQQIAGAIPGVQLAYIPQGAGELTPYPKVTFWCSDEAIDITSAVVKMTSDAGKMYKPRTGPIRQSIPLATEVRFKEAT